MNLKKHADKLTNRYLRTWPGGRCDTRHSRILTDCKLSQKRNIGEMYSTIWVEWDRWSFWLDVNRSTSEERTYANMRKNYFLPSDLDLW